MKVLSLIGALALLALDPASPAKKPPSPDPMAAARQVEDILQLEGGSFGHDEFQSITESIAGPSVSADYCWLRFIASRRLIDNSADTITVSSWDDVVLIPLWATSPSTGPALLDGKARAIELSSPTAAIKITHGSQHGPKAPLRTSETSQRWEFVFAQSDQDTIKQAEQLTAALIVLQNSCKLKAMNP